MTTASKLVSLAFGFILLLSLASSAQTAAVPDLTGSWEFESPKSYAFKNVLLNINQTGESIELADSLEFEGKVIANKTVLFPDGRGERNVARFPGDDMRIDIASKTTWKKGKLIRKSTFTTPFQIGAARYASRHTETRTYSLSGDRNTLTVETVATREAIDTNGMPVYSSGKRVYRRRS